MMATRTPLPNRRRNESFDVEWLGRPIHLTVGFDDAGAVREVFATGPREGSDLAHLLSDVCVLISVALQYHLPACALAKSMGTIPVPATNNPGADPAAAPASVAGLILSAIEARQ